MPIALGLLGDPGEPGTLVFPSPTRAETMLSDMALTAVLKRMGRGDLTVHGFRSTFRDWRARRAAIPARSSSRLWRIG